MLTTNWLVGFDDDLSVVHNIRKKAQITEEYNNYFSKELDEDAFILIVNEEEKPIACGGFTIENNKAIMHSIAVVKEYQGKKIGDFTARVIIEKALEMGFESVYANCPNKVMTFLTKINFKKLENFENLTMVLDSKDILDCKGCKRYENNIN